jgi:hypoxanthine-guanine phosphoribosyltransferase
MEDIELNTGIRVLISEEDIKNRIVEMAEQINTDYE